MADFHDYLRWRGDLDFSQSPFNEVDAGIFAMLSYLKMRSIVPGCESKVKISIKELAARFFTHYPAAEEKPTLGSIISSVTVTTPPFEERLARLLGELSTCPRFENVQVSRFAEDTDSVVGRQFAAVTFTLPTRRRENVVAFRGTDDTLVGWKEDFGWFYLEEIPAQVSACRYLELAIRKMRAPFYVCGHSKGGNLAVYASTHIRPRHQRRIVKILNFDGPGFDFSVVDREPFAFAESRIVNFVPEESIAGMLFEPVGSRKVVSSSVPISSQHNAFNWNLEGAGFVEGELADIASLLDHTVTAWLSGLSREERKSFLEALFSLVDAYDETTTVSDPVKNLRDIKTILDRYSQLDQETKTLVGQVLESLTEQTKRTMSSSIKLRLPGKAV